MKLPPHATVTAFEQPSVWNWLVVFVCGFLTICIISPVVCFCLWLLGKGAVAVKVPVPSALLDVPLPFAIRGILIFAAVFGALLATLMLVEVVRRKRYELRIPGHHPVIGDFAHSPHFKTWHAHPVLPLGSAVKLNGHGSSPSETQATLWQQFVARYDALSATTTAALLTPPHPLQEASAVTLTPNGINLTRDGRLHVGFEFTTAQEAVWNSEVEEPIPIAVFSPKLELEKTEWITPQG